MSGLIETTLVTQDRDPFSGELRHCNVGIAQNVQGANGNPNGPEIVDGVLHMKGSSEADRDQVVERLAGAVVGKFFYDHSAAMKGGIDVDGKPGSAPFCEGCPALRQCTAGVAVLQALAMTEYFLHNSDGSVTHVEIDYIPLGRVYIVTIGDTEI